jgi:hypothetical protein
MLFLWLLSCGQKQYTEQECRTLAAPKAYLDRCMGGNINSDYIGDLKCSPFAKSRLRGILVTAFETSSFCGVRALRAVR